MCSKHPDSTVISCSRIVPFASPGTSRFTSIDSVDPEERLCRWNFCRVHIEITFSSGVELVVPATENQVMAIVQRFQAHSSLLLVFSELSFRLPAGIEHWWNHFTAPVHTLMLTGTFSVNALITVTSLCPSLRRISLTQATVYGAPYRLNQCLTSSISKLQ